MRAPLTIPAALALLDAWEREEMGAARPCPDLLGWIADARTLLAARPDACADTLAEVEIMATSTAPAVGCYTPAPADLDPLPRGFLMGFALLMAGAALAVGLLPATITAVLAVLAQGLTG